MRSEGKSWQQQRELAKPAFTTERLCTNLRPMAECTEHLLADWRQLPNNEPIDLFRTMTRLTLAIVGETLFGVDLSDQQAHAGTAFEAALDAIGRRGPGGLQIPLWIPTPGNIRIGMHFSLYEAVMVLTLILREYRLRNLDPSLVGVRAAGTLRPARKILMNLERIY